MSLSEEKEELSLDARLLSDAITELNICRHKVAIYPKDHPAVEESLRKGFDFLEKLFELRPEISLKASAHLLVESAIIATFLPISLKYSARVIPV